MLHINHFAWFNNQENAKCYLQNERLGLKRTTQCYSLSDYSVHCNKMLTKDTLLNQVQRCYLHWRHYSQHTTMLDSLPLLGEYHRELPDAKRASANQFSVWRCRLCLPRRRRLVDRSILWRNPRCRRAPLLELKTRKHERKNNVLVTV